MNRRILFLAVLMVPLLAGTAGACLQDPPAAAEPRSPESRVLPPAVTELIPSQDDPKKIMTTLEVVLLFGVLSLAPSILMLLTSFTRIVIVLSFVRRALGTPDLPPNPVIVGLSLLLTFMVMSPTIASIKKDAVDPYTTADTAQRITQTEALKRSEGHIRGFMFQHARAADLSMFMDITKQPRKTDGWTEADVPTEVLVPSFVLSELRRAFIMGFALFLPFLVIDLVVSAVLVSMGMIMLPPVLISLPFKILLFVLVDGWNLVVGSVVRSFYPA